MSEPQEQTEAQKRLNPKQELFCQLYATRTEFFGNGVQSYVEAYEPDQHKPNWYNTARAVASEMLSNPNILARINELLDLTLNDAHVDKQLAIVVTQNADYNAKVKAIEQFNKLRGRITDKLDITSKGKRVGGPITPEAEAAFDNIFNKNGVTEQDTPTN